MEEEGKEDKAPMLKQT